jgi:predicted anti-sigma-YlaC factor YlaD
VSADEIVCREFVELATEFLEASLPPETLELVEEHLLMCDWCRDYVAQIEATAVAVAAAQAPAAEPPDEAMRALLDAFRRRGTGGEGP